jgi:hypothetical protein
VQCSSKQTDLTFIHEDVESIGAISDPACAGKSSATYPQAQSSDIFTSKKKQRNSNKKRKHSSITLNTSPGFCHVFSSTNRVSSQRTRAAAGAYLSWSSSQLLSRNTVRNRKRAYHRKKYKLESKLDSISITSEMEGAAAIFSPTFLTENVVVFDGSVDSSTVVAPNTSVPGWTQFSVVDGPLVVCEPTSTEKGLIFHRDNDNQPQFVLLPRKDAVAINPDGHRICKAMASLSKKTSNLVRGESKTVFGNNKYCCVGSKPRRNSPGVEPGIFKFDGIGKEQWDCVVDAVKRCEHAFHAYVDSDVIAHIREARKLVPWETIQYSGATPSPNPSIFNGIAFGVNVFLRAHIDNDFTYSVIQVHVDCMNYSSDDNIVCYFCFPCLGVAVPLRPGDFLLVNALEYHCLSSRVNADVDIFCVSSYLKTAVVGGNDNKRPLSEEEQMCLLAYENDLSKK